MFSDAHVAELKVHKVLAKHEVDTQPYVRMCFRFISFERLPAHVKVPKVSIWIATESRRLEFGLQPTSDGLQPNALILNLQSNLGSNWGSNCLQISTKIGLGARHFLCCKLNFASPWDSSVKQPCSAYTVLGAWGYE